MLVPRLLLASLLASSMACSKHDASPSSTPGVSAAAQPVARAPGPQESSPGAAPPRDTCRRSTQPPLVTTDSIGVLDFRLTVADLRRLCPSVQPEFVIGEESTNNALRFELGSVSVMAWQVVPAGDPLVENKPPDFWRVSGGAARLPSGLTMATRWAALHAAYGSASARLGSSSNSVEVNFCSQPRLDFVMVLADSDRGGRYTDDLSFIPDTATINDVTVNTGPGTGICDLRRRFVHH